MASATTIPKSILESDLRTCPDPACSSFARLPLKVPRVSLTDDRITRAVRAVYCACGGASRSSHRRTRACHRAISAVEPTNSQCEQRNLQGEHSTQIAIAASMFDWLPCAETIRCSVRWFWALQNPAVTRSHWKKSEAVAHVMCNCRFIAFSLALTRLNTSIMPIGSPLRHVQYTSAR